MKATAIIQPIILSQNHAASYLWPQGCTHTPIRTYFGGIKVIIKSQVHAGTRAAPGRHTPGLKSMRFNHIIR